MSLGAPLPASFYDRDPAIVARELLGAVLHVQVDGAYTSGIIVETEAYLGPHDPACHATAGRTARTWHLFGPPGTAYVYRIYGLHWCVNAVTREDGFGSAVLLRAVRPLDGLAVMRERRPRATHDRRLADGPGKLCAAFGITRVFDGASLQSDAITIAAGASVPDAFVAVTPRIGISKAKDWPLRFVVAGRERQPQWSGTKQHP
jgi:DNA-3-methyladenine glycosylase